MTTLLLFAILTLSGALAGYITGILMHRYSLGAPVNMVFGALGAMACLQLVGDVGTASDSLAISSIRLHVGCGLVGGAVLTLVAGFVHKTA